RDAPILIRSDGDFAGAVLRIGGERVQPLDAVQRDADDRGARCGKLFVVLRERVRLQIAAARKRGGIEVHDDRPLLERGLQRVLEYFAVERRGRLEVRRNIAVLQRRGGGQRHGQRE